MLTLTPPAQSLLGPICTTCSHVAEDVSKEGGVGGRMRVAGNMLPALKQWFGAIGVDIELILPLACNCSSKAGVGRNWARFGCARQAGLGLAHHQVGLTYKHSVKVQHKHI
jgi:hypothetical protein